MKFTFIKIVFCLFLSIAFGNQLFAQQSASSQKLSLSDAIQKGLSQNFDIQIEKRNIEISKNNNDWGQAGRYPTINLNATQGNVYNNVVNPAAFQQGTVLNNNIVPTLTLDFVIFDGFAVNITKQRLANIEAQSAGNTRIVIENAVQGIIRAYYNAVLANELINIFKQALDLSRDKYDYVLFKKSLGNAVTGDVLLEKSNYLTDSSAYINQQLIFRNALRDLNVLMGEIDMNKTYELTDKLSFNDINYSLQELEEKMFATNANLQTLAITQEILKNDIDLRKGDRLPRVGFSLNSSYNINRQDLSKAIFPDGRPRDNNVARNLNIFGNLTFTMPIFNGGQINRSIQNAQILEQNGLTRIESLKNLLRRDLANNFDLYNLRKQQVKIAAENKVAAQTNLRLAEEKYRNGSINAFDYRILQENYLNIAFNEQQAIFNFIDANTILLRLTGGITAEK
ncbi:MAG: TolC family protein [Cytophagales bacterium]|nr:MAG: TolC family protein [Cytophagales bacterium]